MDHIPSLDELLDYGDEYKYPDLILSDYFILDKRNANQQLQNSKKQIYGDNSGQDLDRQTDDSLEQSFQEQNDEASQEQNPEQTDDSLEQSFQEQNDEVSQEQNPEQTDDSLEQSFQEQNDEASQEQNPEQTDDSLEQSFQEQNDEVSQEQNPEQTDDSLEQSFQEQNDEASQEQNQEQTDDSLEQSFQEQNDEASQEQNPEHTGDSLDQSFQEQNDEASQEQNPEQTDEETHEQERVENEDDENDFDKLLDNYEQNSITRNESDNDKNVSNKPSDKLESINTTKIYKVLRKLVSLSYERWQKGTYRYNKKEIVKHYLTKQTYKIIDDLVSPTFKPDVYVFDLSPSNNSSLEMYVNAISSFAFKNSIIYLTYNDCILRKLLIKKENSRGIDVNEVAKSQNKKYDNIDCTIFYDYRSLYEELRIIKDRKIYIFSDFDISSDISKLSQENHNIVWFSTENNNYNNYYYRDYPSSYIGYYVETSGIDDIEKFILEKNKFKYRRGSL